MCRVLEFECNSVLMLYIPKVPVGFLEGGFRFRRITVIACIQVRGSGTLWSGRI